MEILKPFHFLLCRPAHNPYRTRRFIRPVCSQADKGEFLVILRGLPLSFAGCKPRNRCALFPLLLCSSSGGKAPRSWKRFLCCSAFAARRISASVSQKSTVRTLLRLVVPTLGLVPCAVVPHTAAYRQVLLVQIDVLPSQAADLANAKPRVVGDLYGQQRRVFPLLSDMPVQLQVLPVGDGRNRETASASSSAEDVRFLLPAPAAVTYCIGLKVISRFGNTAKRNAPCSTAENWSIYPLLIGRRSCPVRVCAAVAHKVNERLQMVGCDGFQPAACLSGYFLIFLTVRRDTP